MHLTYTLARTLRFLLIVSSLRAMTDALPADEEVEDEGENMDAQKDVYNIRSDSDDEEQGDVKIVDNRAKQDGHDHEAEIDVSYADSVKQKERETEDCNICDEGGNNK